MPDASLASPANSDPTRVGATSPTKLDSPKIRSDEDVETLQLTKKEKKTSLEEKPAEIKIETPRESVSSVSEEKTEEEKPAEPIAEAVAEPEKPVETEPEKPVEAEPEKPAETENPPPAEPEEIKENGNAEE